ncbi:MAG: hypothetical protein AAB795_03865 [Patescibacteria group bacterium]
MKNEKLVTHENEKLKKYTYQDNFDNRKIVFECIATDILEADKLYEKATGKNPEKQSNIGCSFKDLVAEE